MFKKEARRFDRMPMRVRESGHAVTLIAVAPMMGWPPDKAVNHIAYAIPDKEEKERLWFASGTHGRFLSADMEVVVKAFAPTELDWRPGPIDEALQMFDRFRRAGCDLKSWTFARYVLALAGAVAESRYAGTDVWSVIEEQFDRSTDMAGLMRDMALLRRRYLSGTLLKLSTEYLEWIFAQPDAWAAVLAIAKALKCGEATSGAEIMRIVNQTVKEIHVRDFNDLPQARIRRDPMSNGVGTCLLADLDDWRYSTVSGGRQVRTEKQFLYVDGNVGHSCKHGDGPHEIWVCVLPEDNRENWDEIGVEAAWGLHHAA